ncbi:MAG: hypothetical protein H6Q10_3180 [Acidobacteria bacterium]|nr:hypothetical protein [Acidobacteriota bacterium]
MPRSWPLVVVASVAVCVLAGAPPAVAQAPAQPTRLQGQAAPQPPLPAADASSLRRIRRLLAETPPASPSAKLSLLKLNYYVQVVGKAPRYDLLTGFNVGRGTPVQYGAMSHDEFLRLAAPPWRRLAW